MPRLPALRLAITFGLAVLATTACPGRPPGTRAADQGDAGPGVPPVDAGPPDAGRPDAGPPDAGQPDAGPPDAGRPDAGPPDAGPQAVFPAACPDIFSDTELQTFELEIAPEEWAALQEEHSNAEARERAGLPVEPYHPVLSFRHGDRVRRGGTHVRLRGNPTWWEKQEKMQLQVSFNETHPDGRFRGLRKVVLDSGHYNASLMRDRLAMSIFRDLGLPAPCVNHARLVVNGQFYGLFAHLEKEDREFLERNFALPDGNLYKRGEEQKTNEDTSPDSARSAAFWAADTVREMEALGDLDQWIRAWAVEAMLPDADGYWAGGWNFYLYDHPERGFLYLPWDIDLAFDNQPADVDPILWHKQNDNVNGRPHVQAVLDTPEGRDRFVEAVAWAQKAFDPQVLQARLDRWAAQVEAAAREDVHAPWTFEQHQRAVRRLKDHVAARARYLDAWVACQRKRATNGGIPPASTPDGGAPVCP